MDLPSSGDEADFEDADGEREMQTDESAQQRKQQEEQVKEQREQDQEQAGSKKHESNVHSSLLENTMTQTQAQTQTQTDNANQVKQVTQKDGSRHKPQSNIAFKSEDKTKDKLLSRRTSVNISSSSSSSSSYKNTTNTTSRKNTPSATQTHILEYLDPKTGKRKKPDSTPEKNVQEKKHNT